MSARVPRLMRWVLAVAELLVPTHRRKIWRRQWEADLEYECANGTRGPIRLTRFALGSLTHALYLRKEERVMMGVMGDLRQSLRSLWHKPGFAILTALTMALGIGAATAVFSLAETLLLRRLPLEAEHQLVRIFSANPSQGMERFSVSYPDYVDFSHRSDLFQRSTFYMESTRDLSGEGDPERLRIASVHEGFFQMLGSRGVVGRTFLAEDHQPQSEATALLSEGLWMRRFGADSTVAGRTIRLDGVPYTVVGVIPAGQGWPPAAQVWIPLQWGGTAPDWADRRSNHTWQVIARMQPGVKAGTASDQIAEMAGLIYSSAGDERDEGISALAVPLRSSASGERTGPIIGVMGAAVFLVLLISCINASGLLLTRAWGRAREFSLRSALGAGRGRLAALILGESVLLALIGGGLGVLLAFIGISQALRLGPVGPDRLSDAQLNMTVLTGALVISVIAAMMAGLVPAIRASRTSVSEALKEGGAQASQGRSGARLRRGLVVVELALSLALLVASGMTIRGFQRQLTTDPGFDPENLLTLTVRLPATRYGSRDLIDAYYDGAQARLERHPGIASATTTSRLPMGGGGLGLTRAFIFDGATPPPEGVTYDAAWVEIGPEYFQTLGIRPVRGREFTSEDRADTPLVAIVNEAMARKMGGGGELLDRTIRSIYDENLPRTVVGVIGDIQFDGLSHGDEPLVLVPRAQSPRRAMALIVRTAGDPHETIPVVREVMSAHDPDVALDGLRTMRDAHWGDLAGVRFLTVLFAAFGALALILAVSGVYGLVSYSVSQRTHEFGIRMAIGASAASVRKQVMSEGALLTALGVTIGLGLAYGFSRLLTAALFGIILLDLTTLVGVSSLLVLSVVAASWLPARRATRVDPVEALRSD